MCLATLNRIYALVTLETSRHLGALWQSSLVKVTAEKLKAVGAERMSLDERKRRRRALDVLDAPSFMEILKQHGVEQEMKRTTPEILQLNIGLCVHIYPSLHSRTTTRAPRHPWHPWPPSSIRTLTVFSRPRNTTLGHPMPHTSTFT